MEQTEKILSKIRDVAVKLNRDKAVYTRADLAYDLKSCGIANDSADVSRLVCEAWSRFGDEAIRTSFLTNDRKHTVVDSYMAAFHDGNQVDDMFAIVMTHLGKSVKSLSDVSLDIGKTVSKAVSSSDFMSFLTGTKGAADVKVSASVAFEKYSAMVGAYENAKADVQQVMADFVFLREKVVDMFMQYSMALVDIFGDSIKVIAPSLFDFNTVEWLDVQTMLKAMSLEYDSIATSCSALVSEITDDFNSSLKQSSALYRSAGSRQAGLVLAGLSLLDHYIDSGQKTAILKQEFVKFSDKMKKDAVAIKGDIERLFLIYRTLDELYIPKAEAFFKYAGNVFNDEFCRLLGSIYSTPELKRLKTERDKVFDEYKRVQDRIMDAQLNIGMYKANIDSNQRLLDGSRKDYLEAKRSKPTKPFILLNILSLGTLGKRYDRDLSEWYETFSPAIRNYENIQTDLNADKAELESFTATLKTDEKNADRLRRQLGRMSVEMKSMVKATTMTKRKVASHLNDIVVLLKIAKDIASSSLDEKYVKAVKPAEYSSLEIPAEVERNIGAFTEMLRESAAPTSNVREQENPQTMEGIPEAADMDVRDIATTSDEIMQKTINLFEECARLEALKRQSALRDAEYARRLSLLQDEFRKNMNSITDKGDILRQSLKKMNLSTSIDEVKAALMTLAGPEAGGLTDREFEQFFDGTKDLKI